MWNLNALPKRDRKTTLAAAGFLFVLMVGHAALETARDALFLTELPAERLPYVYIMIAGVALLASRGANWLRSMIRPDVVLRVWLGLSAAITLLFWLYVDAFGSMGFYALYVWTGVQTTVAFVLFWPLLGDLLSLSRAKHVYAFIGAGSAAGAAVGSGIAGLLAQFFTARAVLFVAAVTVALSIIGPHLMARWNREALRPLDADSNETGLGETIKLVLGEAYTRRIGILVILSAMALTVADYVFKSAAERSLSPEHLGVFFGTTYFVVNGLSLAIQLFAVNPLMRRLTVPVTLAILPSLLLAGGVGFVITGGIVAAVAIEAAGGSLRHSLHRTALEILYVPLTRQSRANLKLFNGVVGQRGAQALGSLVILLGVASWSEVTVFGISLIVLTIAWLVTAARLRHSYLDMFRSSLEPELDVRFDFPDLDVDSLESLMTALNHPNDARVMAALELLALADRVPTIPALILYHPSDEVVLYALRLFAEHERADFIPIAKRVVDRASPLVQAALVSAMARLEPDREELRAWFGVDEPDAVRVAAAVFLHTYGWWEDENELRSVIHRGADPEDPACNHALLRAMHDADVEGFDEQLVRLLASPERDVRELTMRQMLESGNPHFLAHLRDELATRETRRTTLAVLSEWGVEARDFLIESLDDDLPRMVRWQLPRAIAAFRDNVGADALARALEGEDDGMVVYRITRELERMRLRDPDSFHVEEELLESAYERLVDQSLQLLSWRVTAQEAGEEREDVNTVTHHLLVRLLRDKEKHATETLIRLVALRFADHDIGPAVRALRFDDDRASSAKELIAHVLPGELRAPVMALLDDLSPRGRLETLGDEHRPAEVDYETLMGLLLDTSSSMLRSLAARQIGELGLTEHLDKLRREQAQPPEVNTDATFEMVAQRSLGRLTADV